MSETQALSKDHPAMVAWEKFKESEDFRNALDWALRTKHSDSREIGDEQRREHVLGSLWRMFLEGLNVGSARIAELEAKVATLKRHADAMAEASGPFAEQAGPMWPAGHPANADDTLTHNAVATLNRPPQLPPQQIDIKRASFREIERTPGHVTFGVWINGGKCGDLTIRVEEEVAFRQKMGREFEETRL